MKRTLIHHISDIHFGRFSGDTGNGYQTVPKLTEQYLNFLKVCGLHQLPDRVVVSGDLASTGSRVELQDAAGFLADVHVTVKNRLKKQGESIVDIARFFVVVPGNHDVDWSQWDADLTDDLNSTRTHKAFREVFGNFNTPNTPRGGGASHRSLFFDPDASLLLWAIDSTLYSGSLIDAKNPEDRELAELQKAVIAAQEALSNGASEEQDAAMKLQDAWEKIERIDPGVVHVLNTDHYQEQYDELVKTYDESTIKRALRCAVIHHPVTLTYGIEARRHSGTAGAVFLKKFLQQERFDLIMHGHVHQSNAAKEDLFLNDWDTEGLHLLSAGTLSGEGGKHYNSFNVVEVSRNGKGSAFTIDQFSSDDGRFNPKSPTAVARFYRGDERLPKVEQKFHQLLSQPDLSPTFEEVSDRFSRFLERGPVGYDHYQTVYPDWLRHADRIYAVDAQGVAGWAEPSVFRYLFAQAKKIGLTSQAHRGFSEEVIKAIGRANEQPPEAGPLFETAKPLEKDETPLEIVRILVWRKADLAQKAAEHVIALHEEIGIPLFFLDASTVVRCWTKVDAERLKGLSPEEQLKKSGRLMEYAVFTGPGVGKKPGVAWLNLADHNQEEDEIVRNGYVPHFGSALQEFHGLLQSDDLVWAQKAHEEVHDNL